MKRTFDCQICGEPDNGKGIGGWSVSTGLWNKIMLKDRKLIICMDCFEERLGRRLTYKDFAKNSIDNHTNKEVQKIFADVERKYKLSDY